jgi:hypothetical protein
MHSSTYIPIDRNHGWSVRRSQFNDEFLHVLYKINEAREPWQDVSIGLSADRCNYTFFAISLRPVIVGCQFASMFHFPARCSDVGNSP